MILIIGGAGYIGSHLNKKMVEKGYQTIVFDNLSCGHEEFIKWGIFEKGDLGNIDDIRNVFRKYSIEAVMHFAAFTYVGESVKDPQKYYINNVMNTINLLKVMLEFNVKYLIFSSSCATYGNPNSIPLTETHIQNPISPYGRSKLMVEQILKDYTEAYNIKYISLRYFNAAGCDPDLETGELHEPETHLIPIVLEVASSKREFINIFGDNYDTPDGTCIRDYIHVNDIADAHILSLEYLRRTNISNVFNLGNGCGFSVKQIIETVRKVTGKEIKTYIKERRDGDPPILIGSSEKAKEILGWEPIYKNIEDIIQTAWNFYKVRQ
jgi:UDP-glucose 4-epimerase